MKIDIFTLKLPDYAIPDYVETKNILFCYSYNFFVGDSLLFM